MRRLFYALAAVAVAQLMVVAGVAPVNAQVGGNEREAAEEVMEQLAAANEGLALEDIDALDELGPNPWLSFTKGRSPEAVKAWQALAAQLPPQAQVPNGKAQIGGPPLVHSETEAVGEVGLNDTVADGEMISSRFGTRPGEKGVVTINGSLSGGTLRDPIPSDCDYNEDDGSIPLANFTPAVEFQVALCVGEIGDGPFGETSGDIDFYSYGVVEEGTILILDTYHISNSLDPVDSVIGIYDADGNLLVSIEDGGLPGDDPWIEFVAPATGEYFAAIAGCCDLSSDPFDSASGPGVGDTGTYELFVVAFPPPCTSVEDDGSIGLANETNVPEQFFDFCVGLIGDGPHAPADTDFYSLGTIEAGFNIFIDLFAFDEPFESIVGVYNSSGDLVASYNETGDFEEEGGFLDHTIEETDTYYVGVAGGAELPSDPTDPTSGVATDQGGLYEILFDVYIPFIPCESIEDDGAIGIASETRVPEQFFDICVGTIGDGPHVPADTDFFSLGTIEAGFNLYVDVFAFEGFESVIGLYNSAGDLVASYNETGDFEDEDGFLDLPITETDAYYVGMAGGSELQADPNDPTSGVATDQAGPYEIIFDTYIPFVPCESVEDDGAIPVASEATGSGDDFLFVAECYGAVGDGPHAGSTGDVDFFRTRELPAGQILLVDFIDIFAPTNAGNLTIGFYDADGNLLATGQDDPSQGGPDSDFFSITVPEAGEYYVAVGGAMPSDPFDPTTGTDSEITSPYEAMFIVDANEEFFEGGLGNWSARIDAPRERRDWSKMVNVPRERRDWSAEDRSLAQLKSAIDARKHDAEADAAEAEEDETPVDVDFYLVDLRKGDAIAGGFDNARTVGIIDPEGVQRSGAQFNPSFIYPLDSPLRHDRRNGFDHVATVDGVHAVFVTDGIAEYEGELRVIRSGLAPDRDRDQQIIFLDFDGAFVSGDTWGTGVDANLSPLSAFIPRWGLEASDEDAVIDATIDAIVETIDHDLRVFDGRNGDRDRTHRGTEFDVEILNSRDHGDRWGDPNVTRIIIGGTIDELLIPTLGIAQSIDPGNTETEETGVVLLDLMSEPAPFEISLNSFPVAGDATKADFIGFTVGHIAAHEIGHLIGNWHQETFNEIEALMDAGGDFEAIAGVGEDGVFGTADDTDPDFVEDEFNFFEGFTGIEDTAGRSVFAFSTGQSRIPGAPGQR